MSSILVVEDEQHLANGLKFNLEAEGHRVAVCGDGEEALRKLEGDDARSFDAVVLDVMLPGKDGFDVTREVRKRGNFVPILMLTARGRAEDVLRGFESGADDYLPKPFELKILLARIHGLIRRFEWTRGAHAPSQEQPNNVVTLPGRTIDFGGFQVRAGKVTYPLTAMEADLLRFLVRNEGKPVSRKAILEEVWGLHEDTDTRAIDNFIVRLRRYIEESPEKPKHLVTVRGVGYKFVSG